MTHVNPVFNQTNYRIRSGDTVGLNTDSGWAAALNTGATITVDSTFRVRVEIDETNSATTPTAPGGQLEAALNGGAFQNVTTTSTIVKAVASGQFSDEAATTNLLAGSGRGFVAGVGSHDGLANAPGALSNQHTELEYCVQIVGADVADTNTVTMRVAALGAYTNTVTVTVNKPAPAVEIPQLVIPQGYGVSPWRTRR